MSRDSFVNKDPDVVLFFCDCCCFVDDFLKPNSIASISSSGNALDGCFDFLAGRNESSTISSLSVIVVMVLRLRFILEVVRVRVTDTIFSKSSKKHFYLVL